VLALLALF